MATKLKVDPKIKVAALSVVFARDQNPEQLHQGIIVELMPFRGSKNPNAIQQPTNCFIDYNLLLSAGVIEEFKPKAMSIVAWNVRGAGNEKFLRNIKDLINSSEPDLLVLTETRTTEERAEDILPLLDTFNAAKTVAGDGMAGGIWALWNTSRVQCDFLSSSFQDLHLLVTSQQLPQY